MLARNSRYANTTRKYFHWDIPTSSCLSLNAMILWNGSSAVHAHTRTRTPNTYGAWEESERICYYLNLFSCSPPRFVFPGCHRRLRSHFEASAENRIECVWVWVCVCVWLHDTCTTFYLVCEHLHTTECAATYHSIGQKINWWNNIRDAKWNSGARSARFTYASSVDTRSHYHRYKCVRGRLNICNVCRFLYIIICSNSPLDSLCRITQPWPCDESCYIFYLFTFFVYFA